MIKYISNWKTKKRFKILADYENGKAKEYEEYISTLDKDEDGNPIDYEEDGYSFRPSRVEGIREVATNGNWNLYRQYVDVAWYSQCRFCGFIKGSSTMSKTSKGTLGVVYDENNEYIYCPMCGKKMIKKKKGNK